VWDSPIHERWEWVGPPTPQACLGSRSPLYKTEVGSCGNTSKKEKVGERSKDED